MTTHRRQPKRIFGWLLCALLVAASGQAFALTLPDNSSKSCTDQCLKITNTNTTYNAIWGSASGNGQGVMGGSVGGAGVYGFTTSGSGLLGNSSTGNGAFAQSGGTSSSVAGVVGWCGSNTSSTQCRGVKGFVYPGTSGVAVYGDAGNGAQPWAGYFVGDVSALNYFNNSDARLKTNVKDLTHATESLLKLRPVTYQWKERGAESAEQMGLIAQESAGSISKCGPLRCEQRDARSQLRGDGPRADQDGAGAAGDDSAARIAGCCAGGKAQLLCGLVAHAVRFGAGCRNLSWPAGSWGGCSTSQGIVRRNQGSHRGHATRSLGGFAASIRRASYGVQPVGAGAPVMIH